MGVELEATEEGVAGSEMEKRWDLVFKALGMRCQHEALPQLKWGSLLLSRSARALVINLFPFAGSNKSFTICHQGLQLWAENSFRTLPLLCI